MRSNSLVGCIDLLPLTVGLFEATIPASADVQTVNRSIDIAAPADQVWHLFNVSLDIKA
ncbi:MAG: hypothetical protein ACI8PT_001499 [Gammaproteobacteria bacterium]|jgi:hypothetical protein